MSDTGDIKLERCDLYHHGIDCLVDMHLAGLGHVLQSNFQQKIFSVPIVHLFNKYFLKVYFVPDTYIGTRVKHRQSATLKGLIFC